MYIFNGIIIECADLIRKMLTVAPAKRYSLQQVTQHRWFVRDIPDNIKNLIKTSLKPEENKLTNIPSTSTLTVDRRLSSKPLDPTVMIFMQQHSNWSEEQIVEVNIFILHQQFLY